MFVWGGLFSVCVWGVICFWLFCFFFQNYSKCTGFLSGYSTGFTSLLYRKKVSQKCLQVSSIMSHDDKTLQGTCVANIKIGSEEKWNIKYEELVCRNTNKNQLHNNIASAMLIHRLKFLEKLQAFQENPSPHIKLNLWQWLSEVIRWALSGAYFFQKCRTIMSLSGLKSSVGNFY